MAQVYRFFPWVRRGLAAGLPAIQPPPARGTVSYKVTVTADIVAERSAQLYGPGDIIGIDQRLIVRTDPRRAARDVEPNYLPSIEFDTPDFPWLFTPSSADASRRLAPWLVLVCVNADVVAEPNLTARRPLPSIKVPGPADAQLPDLADSWAWAHAQRFAQAGDVSDSDALNRAPDLNVSRLICPRRLEEDRKYFVCLVPAWDAGRDAGLGIPRADAAAPLAPAWKPDSTDVELPVYFHYEFTTGTAGDFEALARRLTPLVVDTNGLTADEQRAGRVYLGAADGQIDTAQAMPPNAPQSSIRFDAPLETLDRPLPTIADVPAAFVTAVDRLVSPAAPNELLPPIYGDRFARRDDVDPAHLTTTWLDELNLDPRSRLAARFGGDVVRKFQEELMHVAWEQVGDVMTANSQLARSRFLAIVAARALERHVSALPASRFLAVTSLLHHRVRLDELTVAAKITATSLPDRAFDPALRRLTSPVGRAARVSPSRTRVSSNPELSRTVADALQRSDVAVDPSLVERDGVHQFEIGRRAKELGWNSIVSPFTPDLQMPIGQVNANREIDLNLRIRDDMAATGLFTAEHLRVAAQIEAATGVATQQILELAAATMKQTPDALQIGFKAPVVAGGALEVSALKVTLPGGGIFAPGGIVNDSIIDTGAVITEVHPGGQETKLVTIGTALFSAMLTPQERLERLLVHLPAPAAGAATATIADGVQAGTDASRFTFVVRDASNSELLKYTGTVLGRKVHSRGGGNFRPPDGLLRGRAPRNLRIDETTTAASGSKTSLFVGVMPPLAHIVSASTFDTAYQEMAGALPAAAAAQHLVLAPLASTAATPGYADSLRDAIAPGEVFRRRAEMIVKIPEWIDRTGMDILDPISAAPVVDVAAVELFAKSAPERILPAEVSLPDDSVAALQTNPRFVAAFMVGANHEFNRELLWRTYPSDARGTSISRFWNWTDRSRHDVETIGLWPGTGPLVERLAGGQAPQIAMVIRGRLLRRYPNTHLLAWKAKSIGVLEEIPADPAKVRDVLLTPQFTLTIEPDITVAGFEITGSQFLAEPGWYLVLQEPVTEARFGLDDNQGRGPSRRGSTRANDLDWAKTAVAPGGHLTPAPLAMTTGDSARVANLLLQRQVRFAIHSSELAPVLSQDQR